MITETTTKFRGKIYSEETKTGKTKRTVGVEEEQVTLTPLEVKMESFDQREKAMSSQGYEKLDEDNYYKKLDDENQKVKFVRFRNNRVSIFQRNHFLEIGSEIYNGPITYLEDLIPYLSE